MEWIVSVKGDRFCDNTNYCNGTCFSREGMKESILDDHSNKPEIPINETNENEGNCPHFIFGFEISVVSEDNELGFSSYGWAGEKKIIIARNDTEGYRIFLNHDKWEEILKRASIIRKALNMRT